MTNRILPLAVRENQLNSRIDESQVSGLGKLRINWDVGDLPGVVSVRGTRIREAYPMGEGEPTMMLGERVKL